MRKMIFVLLFSGMGCIFAQNSSVINGIWSRKKIDTIKLFHTANGNLHEITSSEVGANGGFSLTFVPSQEGYYVLGLSPSQITNRYVFYFKPGDQLNLRVSENSYELTGENTSENKEMMRWHDFIYPLEDKAAYYIGKSSTYKDFFPLLEDKLKELEKYPVVNTPNKKFNGTFEDFRKMDFLANALTFVQTPRSEHPQEKDFIDYYRQINLPELTKNTAMLNYPGGLSLLLQGYMIQVKLDGNLNNEQKGMKYTDPVAYLLGGDDSKVISNDTIKGELALMMARTKKSAVSLTEYGEIYRKYLVTDEQKARWKNVEASLNKNSERREAIDFKFADKTGKEFSLSGFKGKVVYVDIWATWCGPCKKEFPFLKKLEAEYHGNDNVVFMGVSVDVTKNKQKWIDFLEKEQLPGIQVFAGDAANEMLMKPYKISGIPRFILVGKDGKLIFADAPRPSSNEIKAIINSALKE